MDSVSFSYPKLKPVAKHKVRIYTATCKYHMRRFFIREKKNVGNRVEHVCNQSFSTNLNHQYGTISSSHHQIQL